MTDQAQAVDDSDVQARMAQYLEAEDAQPEEPEEPETEEQEGEEPEAEAEETEAEAEAEAEPEEEVLELSWNGETKALKKSEVVELAQKGFDYTQKTQALAEERKSLAAQAEAIQQQAYINSHLSGKMAEIKAVENQIAQYKAVNWQELAQTDPMQYLTLNQTFQQLKEQRGELVGEYQHAANQLTQAQQAHKAKQLEHEMRLMAEAIPELRGPKAQETQRDLSTYLQQYGFTDAEIGSIADHRMVKVIYDAVRFARLKSSQPEVKKRMAEAPKVVKGKQPAPNSAARELRDRAKRGDESAMIALLAKTL